MSGLWEVAGVPHRGWECAGAEDLGEPAATCEMCGKEAIRYVHDMIHPDYPDVVSVGCVCAGNMEGDRGAPRERERRLQNLANRRQRWLTRKWKISRSGNEYLKINDTLVVCYARPDGYGLVIGGRLGRLTYPDDRSAKMRAFEYLAKKGAFAGAVGNAP